MKQWSIYLFPFDKEKPHPVVVLSNDELCGNEDFPHVNALICTTVRESRPPKRREFFLDESDGLQWKTAVRCDFIYALPKNEFGEMRGFVSEKRRKEIAKKIAECYRFPLFAT